MSLFSFNSEENQNCRQGPGLNITEFCEKVKLYDFNLRLSVNLTNYLDVHAPRDIFTICKTLGADQVTLRKLYASRDGSIQSLWVAENSMDDDVYCDLQCYVSEAPALRQLEYGQIAHEIMGMSVVLDDDCMAKGDNADFKYLIIRPNGKLYSSWDDPASLIF
jgi:hypothetical protein